MSYPTKIATCCHCGTKAALVLDQKQHTLICEACGAPLRNLKRVPVAASAAAPAVTHRPKVREFAKPETKKRKPKKSKTRKSWFGDRLKDMAEEVFDAVEDIFD